MKKQWKEFVNSLYANGNKRELEICEQTFAIVNNKKAQTYCLMLIKLLDGESSK